MPPRWVLLGLADRGDADAVVTRSTALRHLAIGLLVAASGYAAARLGYVFQIRPAGVSVVWPPSGLILAILVSLERRYWPAVLIGAFTGNFVADTSQGLSPLLALAGSAVNAGESLLAAWFLVRYAGPRLSLTTLKEVGWLVIGAAVLCNGLTALAGALVISRGTLDRFWEGWFVWWAGDGMGMLVVAPVILVWRHVFASRERIPLAQLAEAALVLIVLGALANYSLTDRASSFAAWGGHPYLAFPLLIWAAIRFGPWGAATASFVLAAVTIWSASQALGVLVEPDRSRLDQVLGVYSFLALAGLSSLVPASILAERKSTELRLTESEGRFRQMAEFIGETFLIVDLPTGKPLYVSPMWSRIWGRPLEEGYDLRVWFDSAVPDDRRRMVEWQERVSRGEKSIATFRIRRPDGGVRWIRGRAFPVQDEAGGVHRLVAVCEDITDLRQAETRLAQSQKMEALGRLAGGVAHDFNNLLTVIQGETQLLGDALVDDSVSQESLGHILRATERAAGLTRQLLAFSRHHLVEPVVFDLNVLVAEMAAMLRRLIGEDVRLETILPQYPMPVRADRGQIEQVITNLAVNARDAMPTGGSLTLEIVTTRLEEPRPGSGSELRAGEYVVLAMSDTGTGMTAEVQAHIFEPFYTTKSLGQGTGLGLATSLGILQQADGNLTAYSELGLGSTFRMYLPLIPVDQVDAILAEAMVPPRGNETILVVEDEPAVRRIVVQLLEGQGYTVLEAGHAEEAERRLSEYPGAVDLLLTDVVLPGLGGREIAERSKASRPGIRTLFMSGYTDDAILRHRLLEHNVSLIQKPFTREELARKVREVLTSPRTG
jgi:PAS domain S-box-containing protein